MKYPKVSVVISTYKRPEMLVECIESVLAQTYDDFEIIVVDDGSFTAKKALEPLKDKATARGIRLLVIEMEENSGYQAKPKNIGISKAQGSYIAHGDDDDLWDEDHLEALMEEMEKGSCELVYGRWRVANSGFEGPPDGSEFPYTPFNHLTAQLITSGPMTNFISCHSLFSKAAAIGFLGSAPWNEETRRFGDWNMYRRMIACGLRFRGIDKVTFTYRWGHGNLQLTRPAVETTANIKHRMEVKA